MKRVGFLRGGDASTSVRVVTIMVIVLGAVVTGSVSLILEDVLPKSNPEDVIVASRWAFLGSSVLLVALAVWLRYEVRSFSGTLFSVQVLDEGVADRVNEGGMDFRSAANHRYMYLRSVHRWVDYERSVHAGVVDVPELCHEIGVTLETLMNTAADEGRKTIAPNMPWPMAMAVGAYLPARQADIHVLELPQRETDAEHEFPLRPGGSPVTVPTIRDVHGLRPTPPGRVGVFLSLGEADPAAPEQLRGFGADLVYTIAVPPGGKDTGRARYEEPELESCGRRIAEELTTIKADHPGTELVVAARISAAVALSAGWHLTQHRYPFYRDTYLLSFDGDGWVAMRVRPSQPHFTTGARAASPPSPVPRPGTSAEPGEVDGAAATSDRHPPHR